MFDQSIKRLELTQYKDNSFIIIPLPTLSPLSLFFLLLPSPYLSLFSLLLSLYFLFIQYHCYSYSYCHYCSFSCSLKLQFFLLHFLHPPTSFTTISASTIIIFFLLPSLFQLPSLNHSSIFFLLLYPTLFPFPSSSFLNMIAPTLTFRMTTTIIPIGDIKNTISVIKFLSKHVAILFFLHCLFIFIIIFTSVTTEF